MQQTTTDFHRTAQTRTGAQQSDQRVSHRLWNTVSDRTRISLKVVQRTIKVLHLKRRLPLYTKFARPGEVIHQRKPHSKTFPNTNPILHPYN
jgi:hypothetical protein